MKSVSWGIVGTGRASWQFTQGLSLLPNAQIHTVTSREYSKAQTFASFFKSTRACKTYEELLKEPNITVVYIGTPHSLHHQHCIQALESGKHILCEKPFTMTAAEAKEVIKKAREKNLFCMEAMWMRFNPCIRQAVEKIEEGTIGSVRMVLASLGHSLSASADHRLFNPTLGGGSLLDLGVYPLSLAQQILGTPKDVEGMLMEGTTGVDDQASVILRYDSERMASISCSLRTKMSNDCVIMGSAGNIHIHAPLYRPIQLSITHHTPLNMDRVEIFHPMPWPKRIPVLSKMTNFFCEKIRPVLSRQTHNYFQIYEGNGYHYQAMEAMRCIEGGLIESEVMPHRDTIAVMETIDTLRAMQKGKLS